MRTDEFTTSPNNHKHNTLSVDMAWLKLSEKISCVRSIELARIVNASPYDELTLRDNEKLYFTLLSEMPAKENVEKLQTYSSNADEFKIGKNVVYILCRKGYGNSVFNNNFMEKILKVRATTRNLATIKKMSGLE